MEQGNCLTAQKITASAATLKLLLHKHWISCNTF